ncbi:arylamine N-acetyltransferase family protein [Stackebrandtia nassauensis]|uniref:Arylamine N-acetyltransferase n=1 Tax=Stackebrandtia nassauensis (strain DSM 44728 / CIP 108903 / NRRL B-16338 / NBRC 102104 / LLR-40K-21) TaxID=446470 RepID=D3Q0F0_STANL|nr:arylamine N-acetyltransferase [Stackebrandtia nassauensis]ADD39814.1 Arylamine N-acetyltransferase [Stackebrandtia nassauensis DSM 44728]
MSVDVDAYLKRIGVTTPVSVTAESLRTLHLNHLRTIPFENLSIHLGETISLDEAPLLDKVVTRSRGGFCYELNGAFAWLLRELGYTVTLLSARVFAGDNPGPPFDHLALKVDLDEPWLADVGFGAFASHPLRLNDRGDQTDPAGTFRIADAEHGDLIVYENGEPQYRFEAHPRELAEFEAMCWYQQNSPKSHFTKSPVCSRLTDTGRVTLTGRTLKRLADGETTKTTLKVEAEILATYRDLFGVTLDRLPDDPREA